MNDGSDVTKQVVCGADNVSSGKLYPYAKPGAVLRKGLTIEAREIHGVLSAGMLCSAFELGLADSSTGLYEIDVDATPALSCAVYFYLMIIHSIYH